MRYNSEDLLEEDQIRNVALIGIASYVLGIFCIGTTVSTKVHTYMYHYHVSCTHIYNRITMYATLEKRNPKGKGHDGKKKTMDTTRYSTTHVSPVHILGTPNREKRCRQCELCTTANF